MNLNPALPLPPVLYPDSDGQPMSDNTRQLRWIVILFGNLSALFDGRADVFVAADLLWYPVEGRPGVRTAPDVLVVFGRPKGHRGSYMQWEEDGVPLTVVFEILSPSNTWMEMDDKVAFYEEHGVEEFYVYDPEHNRLKAFVRQGSVLLRVRPVQGYVSPRLGIRFDVSGEELVVYGPDGQRFLTFEELKAARRQAEQRADQEQQRADQERQRADQERQRADQERQRADQERQRAARLAELSRKARRGQAGAEELQELDRLEEPPASTTP
jgi:Uma2 family endonuclease